MHTFEAGKGINAIKINENFIEAADLANANETSLLQLSQTALLKDGSNLSQDIINKFQQNETIVLQGRQGDIALTDNKAHFLSLSGTGKIVLPSVPTDQFSHTIILVVAGGSYSLDLGTNGRMIIQKEILDISKPYNVMYIFNKIDRLWYACLTQ